MSHDMHKALEEVNRALRDLAIGRGDIHQRLADAGINIVAIRMDGDLEGYDGRINDLRGKLLRHGPVPDSVAKMSIDEAKDVAGEILALHYELEDYIRELDRTGR